MPYFYFNFLPFSRSPSRGPATHGQTGRYISKLRQVLYQVRMSWLQLLSGPGSIGYMHDWWVSRDGKAMTYWVGGNYTPYMCLCRLNRSCAYISSLWMQLWQLDDYVWRENRELLTNKTELPVIQLRFGDTGEAGDDERGYHTLGKLKCYGINWECC